MLVTWLTEVKVIDLLFSKYLTVFGLGTFKFLFSQAAAAAMGLNFWEIFLCTFSGGFISFFIFYKGATFFSRKSLEKKARKYQKMLAKGKRIRRKNNFSKRNKLVLKVKRSLGLWGVSVLCPLFLSIPIGSIIVAKFYGHRKTAFWIVFFTIFSYSFIMSLIFGVIVSP